MNTKSKNFIAKRDAYIGKIVPVAYQPTPEKPAPVTYNPFSIEPNKPSTYSVNFPRNPPREPTDVPQRTIVSPPAPADPKPLRSLPEKIPPVKLPLRMEEVPSSTLKRKLSSVDVTRSLRDDYPKPSKSSKSSIIPINDMAKINQDQFTQMWPDDPETIPDSPIDDSLIQRIKNLEEENRKSKSDLQEAIKKSEALAQRLKTFKQSLQNAQLTISSLELDLENASNLNEKLRESFSALGDRYIDNSREIAHLKLHNK